MIRITELLAERGPAAAEGEVDRAECLVPLPFSLRVHSVAAGRSIVGASEARFAYGGG